jgi:hypothetical protein
MYPIELKHLSRLCEKFELDPFEIDHSLTYYENKKHLLSLVSGSLFESASKRDYAFFENTEQSHNYRKGSICPRCRGEGSGLHPKWVLNSRKKRYEPYWYFAHSTSKGVKWCYINKRLAIEILSSPETASKYNIK